jgi:hypothetical protein
MVKIVDYKTYQKDDGSEFHTLLIQSGVEAIKSKQTGRTYLTAKAARLSCTFNKETCESLIGSELPGEIAKVAVEPFEYTDKTTGEIITLSHRYEYINEQQSIIKDNLIEKEMVF